MKHLAFATLLSTALAAQSYVPNRVFDTGRGAFTDFESMAADLAKADVVFVGEQHDDPNTHRLELAVLEGLARRGRKVIVSLEMFERDAQEPLEHFLMGHMTEEEFLKVSRPWPRYATDYKPLVDFAISKEWAVVAANVPRPIASEIAKGGLEALQPKSAEDRKLFAADLKCPVDDAYFTRFAEAMGSHPAPGASDDAARKTTERYYFSQCVKDETMAESIAAAFAASRAGDKPPLIVHFNGAFHSDYRLGTAARVARRLPNARINVVNVRPSKDLDAIVATDADRKIGDYVVFTAGK
ncbi:MAG TPA: ChaN family lipoprotein [Vicinamibacterales bacterium]|nr:ChaN family lipoprotein [Vicinamibacterales bacterium]